MGNCIACDVVVKMTWEDFKIEKNFEYNTGFQITDIECPKCGEKIYMDTTIVLTSIPPKHRYCCMKCFWEGEA